MLRLYGVREFDPSFKLTCRRGWFSLGILASQILWNGSFQGAEGGDISPWNIYGNITNGGIYHVYYYETKPVDN